MRFLRRDSLRGKGRRPASVQTMVILIGPSAEGIGVNAEPRTPGPGRRPPPGERPAEFRNVETAQPWLPFVAWT